MINLPANLLHVARHLSSVRKFLNVSIAKRMGSCTVCLSIVATTCFAVLSPVIASEIQSTYEYDDLNRLVRMSNSCGVVHTYNYDAAGNMTNRSVSLSDSGASDQCDQATASRTIPEAQWVLLGLPLNSSLSSVAEVFGPAVGVENYEVTWILFAYDPVGSNGGYRKMALTDAMQTGVGYWFIHYSDGPIELEVPSSNTIVANAQGDECLNGGDCLTLDFTAPVGNNVYWMILANPYAASLDMETLFLGQLRDSVFSTTSIAEQTSQIAHPGGLYAYRVGDDGNSNYELVESTGSLAPWEAGWIAIQPAATPVTRVFAGISVYDMRERIPVLVDGIEIFNDQFSSSEPLLSDWTVTTQSGCCGTGLPAQYSKTNDKLMLVLEGQSSGVQGIGDGSGFTPKNIQLGGDFYVETSLEELLRTRNRGYKDNSGVALQILNTQDDAVVSAIYIAGNHSGYFEGYSYNEYEGHRIQGMDNIVLEELDLNALYDVKFRISRVGDLFTAGYKIGSEWVDHAQTISVSGVLYPQLAIFSGDGGGTVQNGNLTVAVDYFKVFVER